MSMAKHDNKAAASVGDIVTAAVTDMSTSGEGIGHVDGYTLFIKDAVIGDTVEARLTMTKKNYGYAEVTALIEPSPDRVEPRCPLSGRCGGCTLQSLSYPAQLRYKKAQVENDLRRIGGLDVPVNDVIGMEDPWRYRNKSQYPVGWRENAAKEREPVCGYYAGRSHRIIPVKDCLISGESDADITRTVLDYMREYGITPYDEASGRGEVRHILIRRGQATGEVMVCLIVTEDGRKIGGHLAGRLCEAVPGFKSLCLNINNRRDNVILGDEVVPVYGDPFIYDKIGGLTFRISPLSFYQVNPTQTKKLYDTVRTFAGLTGQETVLDLYCGIGTIGLYLADGAKDLYGVEIVPEAIRDAKENAVRNGITNAHFAVGASEDIFKDLPDADVVILDPPRKGCDEALLDGLIERSPMRIVYVSCNPATLARDLKRLTEGGYCVEAVQPCDMFPASLHIEVVSLLQKMSNTREKTITLDVEMEGYYRLKNETEKA